MLLGNKGTGVGGRLGCSEGYHSRGGGLSLQGLWVITPGAEGYHSRDRGSACDTAYEECLINAGRGVPSLPETAAGLIPLPTKSSLATAGASVSELSQSWISKG